MIQYIHNTDIPHRRIQSKESTMTLPKNSTRKQLEKMLDYRDGNLYWNGYHTNHGKTT